jgi:hypothetical protein
MKDPFDPAELQLPGGPQTTPRPSRKPPRHRPGEKFLKGPIPWRWLTRAARLPGKALTVALLVWREAGWRKSRTVPLCLNAGKEVGVSRQTIRRAARALAAAGLVAIRSAPGRCLEVTILDASSE